MRKLLLFTLIGICFTSCYEANTTRDGAWTETDKGLKLRLLDISFNDETHQYLYYHGYYEGSLSHWAGCKYCEEKKKVEYENNN